MIVLSCYQVDALVKAHHAGHSTVSVSPDLGLTTIEARLEEVGVHFPDRADAPLPWDALQVVLDSPVACFAYEGGVLHKIEAFSETTNRYCSLMPTQGAPTLLLSGIPMHRIKGTDPYHDTLTKIKCVKPVVGRVLDTATGLGYTAIEAARTAESVITIELDEAVLQVARQNPWSQGLFDNPKITQVLGDSFEKIIEFEDRSFARIIHDPPAFSLAGDLYSGDFYRQLYRVLSNRGVLFHYIGDLDSKSGQRVSRGVSRRLNEAGFRRITSRYEAFGLVAQK